MDSRSQSGSDGEGGHSGRSPSSASSPGAPHDEGRPQTRGGPPGPGLSNSQAPLPPTVSSLDQIRITGSCNEYTEGPTAAQVCPASHERQQTIDRGPSPVSRTGGQQETREERPNNLRNLHPLTAHASVSSEQEGVLLSSTVEDSQGDITTSVGSTPSGQRLIGGPAFANHIVRTQPKRAELNPEVLKPLNEESRAIMAVPGSSSCKSHSRKCENCGRCQCSECTRPRVLPSCWMCGRRCMCSVQSAVEYGTCVCCVKGLFYHCSSDDEDTCADKPFSCAQPNCCVRWTSVSLLAVVFPCLLCYLPAKGCVAVCQSCYRRVPRPGCRCKTTAPTAARALASRCK